MIKRRQFWEHYLFWACFYAVAVFNGLYLSYSFTANPSWKLFIETIAAQGILLLVKIAIAYFLMYQILPIWVKQPQSVSIYLKGIAVLLIGTLLQRVMMYLIIWPIIYKEAAPELTTFQFIARYFYSFLEILQVVGIAVAIKLFRMKINAVSSEKQVMESELGTEISYLKSQLNYHFFYVDKKQVKVLFSDIIYIESLKDYLRIHLSNKKIVTKMQIGAVQQLLEYQSFIRIHKSFIINLEKVSAYSATEIELGQVSLPIGRTYKEKVQEALAIRA